MDNICLYEPLTFPNLLSDIMLTSADIAEQVKSVGYKTDSFICDLAEAAFPIETVQVFYRFVTREQRIPTQEEFMKEARLEMMLNGFDFDGQESSYRHGLAARLTSRTYPSLIRDVHFCKILEEKLSEEYYVIYNPALDLMGIDILLKPKTKVPSYKFGICLYLNTDRGRSGLKRKKNYRRTFHKLKYVDMPKDLPKNSNDGIWLYEESDAKALLERIRRLSPA